MLLLYHKNYGYATEIIINKKVFLKNHKIGIDKQIYIAYNPIMATKRYYLLLKLRLRNRT